VKSREKIVPEKVSIAFGDLTVYQGHPLPEDHLDKLTEYLKTQRWSFGSLLD
jgi:hypothetical protein